MPSLTFEIEGDFDTVQVGKAMKILGELVINKVKEYIRDMNLIISGAFLQGWFATWENNTLTIENTQEYALYLEYGTYGYWESYGVESFTEPLHPKKKELSAMMRKAYPKGMQPFAPIRRVLYNDALMNDLIGEAFNAVT